jgi:hypothetical protein
MWGHGKSKLQKVMKGPKVAAAVQAKGAAVQGYWKSISPVFGDLPPHRSAPAHGAPGAYRDSIVVKDTSDAEGPRARVQDTDFKAKWIEYGSKHMPTYAPLAKTKANFR